MIHSYPWYISDWRESETRLAMTAEQRGVYREALDYCYREGSLPSDRDTLIKVLGITSREFDRAWPKVQSQFYQSDGRFKHCRVDSVLVDLAAYHEQKKRASQKGVMVRRAKNRAVDHVVNRVVDRTVNPSTSTSTSTSSIPPTPATESDIGDAFERIDAIVKSWPTTSGVEMGRRLLADAIAQSSHQAKTLDLAELNLNDWADYYRAKSPQYRKTLANVMRDGDWMHKPPADESTSWMEGL